MSNAKRVKVTSIKSGDSILTTTGMREVVKVRVEAAFVTLYVDDPASPPNFVTALDYPRHAEVTVARVEGQP